jgi:hypothetical protein
MAGALEVRPTALAVRRGSSRARRAALAGGKFVRPVDDTSLAPQAQSNPCSTPAADAQALSVEIKLALPGSVFVSADLGR